jgi:hypothetical protein
MEYEGRTLLWFDDAVIIANACASVHHIRFSVVVVRGVIGDYLWKVEAGSNPYATYVALKA